MENFIISCLIINQFHCKKFAHDESHAIYLLKSTIQLNYFFKYCKFDDW